MALNKVSDSVLASIETHGQNLADQIDGVNRTLQGQYQAMAGNFQGETATATMQFMEGISTAFTNAKVKVLDSKAQAHATRTISANNDQAGKAALSSASNQLPINRQA